MKTINICKILIISAISCSISLAQETNNFKVLNDWEINHLSQPVKSTKMSINSMPGPYITESTCYFNQQGFYTMCQIEMSSPSKAQWIVSYHPYKDNQRTIDILFKGPNGDQQPVISEIQTQERDRIILEQADSTTIEYLSNTGKTTRVELVPKNTDLPMTVTYYYYEDDEPNLDKRSILQNLKLNEKAVFNTKLKTDKFGHTTEVREEMSDGTITMGIREIKYY